MEDLKVSGRITGRDEMNQNNTSVEYAEYQSQNIPSLSKYTNSQNNT